MKNNGIRIMAGSPDEYKFHMKLFLQYVTKEQADSLIEQNVQAFGDFCWVDFENEKQLDSVTKEELARLLYMSHMKEPLDSFKIDSLINEYAYLCHDDGIWNNTYLCDISQYKSVLNYKVSQALKKSGKENMDGNIVNELFEMCTDGLLIDLQEVQTDEIGIYIYSMASAHWMIWKMP
ncbi:hypothetical protein [Acetivibrio saccincola]|jgi:hypothetical protein|uniref:Uncharacterized protein n=2 Tax=Acetivibrio saccincola TaxID=1677857 RepID=A0A2K9E8V1_9FIRM|nr:hypothetical protein [Acetivibrio saccincola]AUG58958.1 hypothetical protein HVS_15590 [Acetivibrio saccincola]NLW26541.1 hypothetical protein [Acetivibrio saccincola]PQQ65963.1 hypothetical protein B9R14_03725 [Acetivibrio saccincola]HQD28839.1 hypothetical protein [Acetivibrio saccincola]